MKKYIGLIFVILFGACHQKHEVSIESIEVLYYNGIFDRAMAIGCDEVVYSPLKADTTLEVLDDGSWLPKEPVILKTTIKDENILTEISTELKKQKTTKRDNIDARMKCYIAYSNGQMDSLCLNEFTTFGMYNNRRVVLPNKFAYLIRKNCGFYKWIGIDQMKYFDELNDTTFVREKVISRFGEEY